MICFHPSITIQINKNAKNPHAILRSELEHARDIAKREVPNQKEKHFSRYSGKNESEMSLGYVKKKADSNALKNKTEAKIEADNTKYNYDVQKGNDSSLVTSEGLSEYTSITIRTKDDKPLGHIRFHDMGNNTFFVDMMENYKKGGGFVRTAIAKVLKDNPDKKVHWQAISDESVRSYKKFCEEYPDFVKRVEFEDRTNVDDILEDLYNAGKRNTNNAEIHSSQQYNGSSENLSRTSEKTNRGYDTTNREQSSQLRVDESKSSTNSSTRVEQNAGISNNRTKQQQGIGEGTQQPISKQLTSTEGNLNQIGILLFQRFFQKILICQYVR